MDRLEAEQDAAREKALECMAELKDEIISDTDRLANVLTTFLNAEYSYAFAFYDLLGKLFALNMPPKNLIPIEDHRLQIMEILDVVNDLSHQVESMVEEYLEDTAEEMK